MGTMGKMSDRNDKLANAIRLIDEANSQDPNLDQVDGDSVPKELLYSRRMTGWLERIAPDASDELKISARAQHIERWKIPRDTYPRDRVNYHKWRNELKAYHARRAGEIMATVGYDEDAIERVSATIQKKRLKSDPEAQTLEDVICLVFLENYLTDFSGTQTEEKMIDILRKTWPKMSKTGHHAALELQLNDTARVLVERALAGEG